MLVVLQPVHTLLLDVMLKTKAMLKEGRSWRVTPTGHAAEMWHFKFSREQGRWAVGAGRSSNRATEVAWGVKQNPKPTPNKQNPPTWHAVRKSRVRTQTNWRQIPVGKRLILMNKDGRKAIKNIFFICNVMESVNYGITLSLPSQKSPELVFLNYLD